MSRRIGMEAKVGLGWAGAASQQPCGQSQPVSGMCSRDAGALVFRLA